MIDGRLPRVGSFGLAALLLTGYFVAATSAVVNKSATFDETVHIAGGYAYLSFGDYRLNPENGNWPQRIGAAAASFGGAAFPSRDVPEWRHSDVWTMGYRFLYESGNDADAVLWRGRASIALLGMALGGLVWGWSRRLFGSVGGWISITLFVLSPTMVAHGALVTSDMAAALAFLAAVGAIWVVLHRVTPATVLLSAFATAALTLSKFSAPIVLPIAFVLALLRLLTGAPLPVRMGTRNAAIAGRGPQAAVLAGITLVHVAAVVLLVWASYGFRFEAFTDKEPGTRFSAAWPLLATAGDRSSPTTAGKIIGWARERRLLPEAYLYGMAHSLKFSQVRPAFKNGEYSLTGWRSFFPYAFAVKTSPALIGFLGLALAALLARAASADSPRAWLKIGAYRTAPLLVLGAVYSGVALGTNLNIGHRHLLPVYPVLFILAGGAGYWWRPGGASRGGDPFTAPFRWPGLGGTPSRVVARVAIVALIGWHTYESISIRPHYLAYFNMFAGGPSQGYRRLVDSSLDWGQDLPGLKRWLDERGLQSNGARPVYLSYFGSSSPEYYGIEAVPLPGFLDMRDTRTPVPMIGGWYCVSATMLQGVYFDPPGPWTEASERRYQELRTPSEVLLHAVWTGDRPRVDEIVRGAGESAWFAMTEEFDQLRNARLMAYLRGRDPVAAVGYSILVFQLSDDDVAAALHGPPPLR